METAKRRKGDYNCGSDNLHSDLCGGSDNRKWLADPGCKDDTQHISRQNNGHHINRILKDQRGGALDFLIVSTLVLFMVFAGVDYFIVFVQHQVAEHITNYYLERVRIEGRLTTTDEGEMINRFASARMIVDSITGPRESAGNPVVTRNPDDPNASKITMTITVKPIERPFIVGKMVGGKTAEGWRIKTGGTVLSERI
jgi:hypothetical protein